MNLCCVTWMLLGLPKASYELGHVFLNNEHEVTEKSVSVFSIFSPC